MAAIVLKKLEARWVADVDGVLHDFRIDNPDDRDMSSFRSIGVHSGGAVLFDCGLAGDVNDVKLLQGNDIVALTELPIPPTHSLSRQISLIAAL